MLIGHVTGLAPLSPPALLASGFRGVVHSVTGMSPGQLILTIGMLYAAFVLIKWWMRFIYESIMETFRAIARPFRIAFAILRSVVRFFRTHPKTGLVIAFFLGDWLMYANTTNNQALVSMQEAAVVVEPEQVVVATAAAAAGNGGGGVLPVVGICLVLMGLAIAYTAFQAMMLPVRLMMFPIRMFIGLVGILEWPVRMLFRGAMPFLAGAAGRVHDAGPWNDVPRKATTAARNVYEEKIKPAKESAVASTKKLCETVIVPTGARVVLATTKVYQDTIQPAAVRAATAVRNFRIQVPTWRNVLVWTMRAVQVAIGAYYVYRTVVYDPNGRTKSYETHDACFEVHEDLEDFFFQVIAKQPERTVMESVVHFVRNLFGKGLPMSSRSVQAGVVHFTLNGTNNDDTLLMYTLKQITLAWFPCYQLHKFCCCVEHPPEDYEMPAAAPNGNDAEDDALVEFLDAVDGDSGAREASRNGQPADDSQYFMSCSSETPDGTSSGLDHSSSEEQVADHSSYSFARGSSKEPNDSSSDLGCSSNEEEVAVNGTYSFAPGSSKESNGSSSDLDSAPADEKVAVHGSYSFVQTRSGDI